MDCIVQGLAKSWTELSEFHFHPFLSKCRRVLEPGNNIFELHFEMITSQLLRNKIDHSKNGKYYF